MEAMNRFLELLPIMFAETLENGYISEEFFEAHGFPIDRDIDGNEWPLDTKADALLRTKVLYTDKRKKQMQDMMVKELNNRRKQISLVTAKAESSFLTNDQIKHQLGAPDRDLAEVTYDEYPN